MSPAQLSTPIQIREPFVFDSAVISTLEIEEEEAEAIEANVLLAAGEEGDF